MAFYQMTLFYPSLRSHQADVRRMRDEIESVSAKRYRVLSAGEQVCAIGFDSELPRDVLVERFKTLGSETFSFLLVEVADVVVGWFSPDTWDWIAKMAPSKRSSPGSR